MRCARCQGLMVQDRFYDLLDDCGLVSLTAWRCVCCGNVVDPTILKNRQKLRAAPSHVEGGLTFRSLESPVRRFPGARHEERL